MNRTLLLILLLIVSAVGLLALSLNIKTTPTVTAPVSIAQTTLVMSPPSASSSGVLTSDIRINTGGNMVSAVQIELSYDPAALTNVDIQPGDFIGGTELFKKIDMDNGRVSYALGIGLGQKQVEGVGIVAKFSFTKVKTAGTTVISFLPKSLASTQGVSQSVLKTATGITFDLSR